MGKKDAIIMMIWLMFPVVGALVAIIVGPCQGPSGEARRAISRFHIEPIAKACILYAEKHNGKWPDNLQRAMEESSYSVESLKNPNREDLDIGYVYIKPAIGCSQLARVLMVYEAYEEWGDGIAVGFTNGEVGFITHEDDFKKLLAEAEQAANDSRKQ